MALLSLGVTRSAIPFLFFLAHVCANAQAPRTDTGVRYPFVIGYRATFGSDGLSGHHINIGMGLLAGRSADDSLDNHPAGAMLTATVEIGFSKGHLVFAPLLSGYIAGGLAGLALGIQIGVLTNWDKVHALLRPAFGIGMLNGPDSGFLMYYAYSFTIPYKQRLVARNVGAIDIAAWPSTRQ